MATLHLPESQNLECKERWKDDYLKWICGFANAYGGYIYIGVVDGTHEIVGIADSKSLLEDIPNKIVSHLGIVADVNLRHMDGLDYIEIVVSPSNIPIYGRGNETCKRLCNVKSGCYQRVAGRYEAVFCLSENVILVGFAWILLGFWWLKMGGLVGLRLCYVGF